VGVVGDGESQLDPDDLGVTDGGPDDELAEALPAVSVSPTTSQSRAIAARSVTHLATPACSPCGLKHVRATEFSIALATTSMVRPSAQYCPVSHRWVFSTSMRVWSSVARKTSSRNHSTVARN
jgi:hypothetical protein